MQSILLIGLGALGSSLLRELVRLKGVKIYAADINEERGKETVKLIASGAVNAGYKPDVKFLKIDLTDVEETAEKLSELEPRVVCNTTALISWWYPHLLPNELAVKVAKLGPGPWAPGHLALTYCLMQAVKKSGIKTRVVNASYNDVVSPVLSKKDLTPHIGAGNLDLWVPVIREEYAKKLKVPIEEVSVYLVAHHALITDPDSTPYILRVYCRGRNVTDAISEEEFRALFPRHYKIEKRWVGPPEQFHITMSFIKNILAVYYDENILTHSPGPLGLPGGYPVKVGYEKVELALPEDIDVNKAIKVNEEAAKHDGVERIKDDGTIVLTDKAYETMNSVFGLDYKEYPLDKSLKIALELKRAYVRVLEEHGITPPYY